ncbi:MAG: TolC family protein [Bryobacterales bacterium]|nr:TolC family protein [Bryobacterales bacterium]
MLVCFACGVALAQQTSPLTLEDCVRLALEAPSQVQTAELEESIASERQTAARAELLPQFGVSSGYVYNSPVANGPNPFSFVALNGVREYLATADTNWSLDLSGRLRAGMALARAGREIASADLAIARRDLRRAVTLAFYDTQLARRIVTLEDANLEEAREFERLARARQQQGEASQADVLKASAQTSQFEQRVEQARLDARLANQILGSFWTADADREIPLADALEAPVEAPPVVSGPSEPEIQHRPELRRLDALTRSYEAQRTIARAGLRPDASVVLQYGLDANQVRADQRGYAAYVNVNVPVFDWFRSRSGVREAKFRQQQVEQERDMAERAFTREYLAARARVQSWRGRLPLAQGELDSARENLRLVRLLYAAGEGAALDVVLSQVQVAQAARSFYSAIAEYQRAVADFEVAAGR